MSFSFSLSAAQQHQLIATANAAVVRFVTIFSDKIRNKHFFTREDIEDIAGNVIMKAWRSIDGYDPEKAKLSSWVYRIAVNCVKDAVDYKMKRLSISGSMFISSNDEGDECNADEYILDPAVLDSMCDNSADDRVLQSDLKGRISQTVSKMSDKRQRVAHMLTVGYTPKEMAAVEGSTPTAMAKCVWDIRQALKVALTEWLKEAC